MIIPECYFSAIPSFEQRHEKRQGWKARETDGIFSTLPMPCRPIVRNERSKDECGFEEFLNSIAPSSDVKEPLLSLSKLVLQWKKDFELLNT